jgi:hypothetical protein
MIRNEKGIDKGVYIDVWVRHEVGMNDSLSLNFTLQLGLCTIITRPSGY